MLRADWQILTSNLPAGRRALVVLAGRSFVSALVEEDVLVPVVAAAMSVSDGSGPIDGGHQASAIRVHIRKLADAASGHGFRPAPSRQMD